MKKKIELSEEIKSILLNHIGADNAITAAEIAKKCKAPLCEGNPSIRKKILETISELNVPIGANNNGYYIISNDDEYQKYLLNLLSRIEKIEARMKMVTKNYAFYKNCYME